MPIWNDVKPEYKDWYGELELGDSLFLRVQRHSVHETEWDIGLFVRRGDNGILELKGWKLRLDPQETIEDAQVQGRALVRVWLITLLSKL